MKPFVHLHSHTAYSLLDGAAKIDEVVQRAVDLEMPALAITDHGTMYGVIEFYNACKKYGIKPIIGCEVYVARTHHLDRQNGREERPYHLILLAENEEGYHNLCKLVSIASIDGMYYKPRVDRELLAKYHTGLIALSACLGGEIPQFLLKEEYEKAKESALWYRDTFGEGNYFLEIQYHGIPEELLVNKGLDRLSQETGIPLVVTNDNHYIDRKDAKIQDVMLCIQTGKTLKDENRMHFSGTEFYLKSYEDILSQLPQYQEAIERTVEIADRCQVEFTFGENHMPVFEIPTGESEKDYLRKLCLEGLKTRYTEVTEEIMERLDYELSVIDSMGFNAYFLIVWDFIDFARRSGIFVGPGRGSAAGSLVSYALHITDIDPLKYNLLFERFLNPERVNMPDIDVDFCYERRGEVIDYVTQKYGEDHVCQIITFGTMAAKGAIRDAGRVMDIPIPIVNKIAKMIPEELGMTLEKAYQASEELRNTIAEDAEMKELFETAKKLEGLPRHSGTHAAGVVISKEPLTNYLPLKKTDDGSIITQFAKEDVESIGLLKMDFLGLRTLTVINKAIERIKENEGIEVVISDIPEEDPETYQMLSDGHSLGVFQLESSGIRSVLRDLKPSNLEDVIALVALYRPGPLGSGMVDDFIQRKHGKKEVEYEHPILEPILNTTYGVILYQEQVMQIASRMAGFSLGQADMLRRAMGKKKPEIIEKLKVEFVEGAEKNGVSSAVANHIFELIEHFAGYGFNKSHSAAYGRLAFETAYLKCHYPKEFMAEMLNSYIDNNDKISFYIEECKRLGIPVLPPDVNESNFGFTVAPKGIRFGLGAVKGVGAVPVNAIVEERQKAPFESLQDFCQRLGTKSGLNKKTVESLIKCGAFQSVHPEKKALLSIYEECLAQGQVIHKMNASDQVSLFDILEEDVSEQFETIPIPECEEFSRKEQLKLEKELLGIYVSGHPLEDYQQSLARMCSHSLKDLTSRDHDKKVVVGGLLTHIQIRTTKKGDMMATCRLEDMYSSIDVLVFPKKLMELRSALIEDSPVFISGRFNQQDDERKIFAESISPLIEDKRRQAMPMTEENEKPKKQTIKAKQAFIKISKENLGRQGLILDELERYEGDIPTFFFYEEGRKTIIVSKKHWMNDSSECAERIKQIVGDDCVVVRDVK